MNENVKNVSGKNFWRLQILPPEVTFMGKTFLWYLTSTLSTALQIWDAVIFKKSLKP